MSVTCSSFVRILHYIINGVMLVCALLILIRNSIAVAEAQSDFQGEFPEWALVLEIVIPVVALLTPIVGICGAVKNSVCLLSVTAGFLILVMILAFVVQSFLLAIPALIATVTAVTLAWDISQSNTRSSKA